MTTMSVVGECFFWYRLNRVVPDKFHRAIKRLCVCVCVCVSVCIADFDGLNSDRTGRGGGQTDSNPNVTWACWSVTLYHARFQETWESGSDCFLVPHMDHYNVKLNIVLINFLQQLPALLHCDTYTSQFSTVAHRSQFQIFLTWPDSINLCNKFLFFLYVFTVYVVNAV